jgi:hypothetical protein
LIFFSTPTCRRIGPGCGYFVKRKIISKSDWGHVTSSLPQDSLSEDFIRFEETARTLQWIVLANISTNVSKKIPEAVQTVNQFVGSILNVLWSIYLNKKILVNLALDWKERNKALRNKCEIHFHLYCFNCYFYRINSKLRFLIQFVICSN